MKAKQKNIRAFEIECDDIEAFRAYMDKNAVLLQGFLLLLNNDETGEFAKECETRGLKHASFGIKSDGAAAPEPLKVKPEEQSEAKSLTEPQELFKTKSEYETKSSLKTKTVFKNLRSGEDIDTDADVTVTGRVNSGANIKTNGNVIILGAVDGCVEAWGEYMILKKIGKGSVSFRGQPIKKETLDGSKTKLITFDTKLNFKDIT